MENVISSTGAESPGFASRSFRTTSGVLRAEIPVSRALHLWQGGIVIRPERTFWLYLAISILTAARSSLQTISLISGVDYLV